MPLRVTAGIVALLFSAGCVTVPEYRALEREVASLKRAQAAGAGGGVSESRARLADLGYEVEELRHEVVIEPAVAERARRSVERMLEIGRGPGR